MEECPVHAHEMAFHSDATIGIVEAVGADHLDRIAGGRTPRSGRQPRGDDVGLARCDGCSMEESHGATSVRHGATMARTTHGGRTVQATVVAAIVRASALRRRRSFGAVGESYLKPAGDSMIRSTVSTTWPASGAHQRAADPVDQRPTDPGVGGVGDRFRVTRLRFDQIRAVLAVVELLAQVAVPALEETVELIHGRAGRSSSAITRSAAVLRIRSSIARKMSSLLA